MGSGHRPGHRGRGRESSSSPVSRDGRVLVLPGDELPGHGLKPGSGTYRTGGRIYASVLGLLSRRPPFVRVIPLAGRYIPKPHDVVIGTVTDVQGTFWLLDIGAPRWAPLHVTGTPWKIEYGEADQYLRIGDSVVVAVEAIENTGRIGVTMNGEELGKLSGGTIVAISPAKVPRVIGKGGSMIKTLTSLTETRIVVGQNGRVWIDGPSEGIQRVRHAIRLIEEESHRAGLTDRIHGFLRSSGRTEESAARPPDRPGREEPADWTADLAPASDDAWEPPDESPNLPDNGA